MSRLTRDRTAEPVSRDRILRREREQGNGYFPCSADHVQDWQPYPVDPYYSCYMCDHTYMQAPPDSHTCFFCLFGDVAFSENLLYHFRFLFVSWRVHRTFFPSEWCLKKNLNASRPSEQPLVRGKNVKTFRWDHRL